MKKFLALALAMTMALGLAACGSSNNSQSSASTGSSSSSNSSQGASSSSSGDTSSSAGNYGEFTTVAEGKLYMSTNAAFPPYEMVADGEGYQGTGYEGIDVEVAYAIAQKLGLELVVDDMDFNSVVTSVQTGKDDIAMAGLTVNPERLENVDFTDSYATGVQVIIVTEDSPIATVDDLANAEQIGVQESTTGWAYCSADPADGGYGADHVTAYPSGANAVQALISGSVDAVVIDNEPAKAYVEANPGLKILDTEFAVEDYAIAVSKENPALREAVNLALNELIEDGTVQSIIDKYINAN
ncbi:MAG: ABC transporter substrate-binding protein [Lawsonibacter sp.]|jgi:ABC-type amino acid transport substrate-binding protein